MNNNLSASIAWRLLRSKKSHSVVGAISVVSIIGMAVVTAAIICVLSVFNGFREISTRNLSQLLPDIEVTPADGKTFSNPDSVIPLIKDIKGVKDVSEVVADNALAIVNTREMPVSLKGVDPQYFRQHSGIDSTLLDGSRISLTCPVDMEEIPTALVSIGAASQLNVLLDDKMIIFVPRRDGHLNPANPIASLVTDSARIEGIFQTQMSKFDNNLVICNIELARSILQYDTEATHLDVSLLPDADSGAIAEKIEKALGGKAVAKDRLRQNEINFRMVAIEKWVSFLLLLFILTIASFNIISSLAMMVVEKERALSLLHSLGMNKKRVGMIFFWESIYVCLAGGVSGIILGTTLSLLQQHFGLIRLSADPASLAVTVYPVAFRAVDILATSATIGAIALATALITYSFARDRISPCRR